jgi:hypothetical protein
VRYLRLIRSRSVKGSLFVDYVRMLRAYKGVDWSPYLDEHDLAYMSSRIQPGDWYPMESFERMGLAILGEIARNDLTLVKHFGRVALDALCKQYDNLVAPGDPHESLLRFQVLRQSFFDFSALEFKDVREKEASMLVDYGMRGKAEEAAAYQTMGFFERLLERAGGEKVRVSLATRKWRQDPATRILMQWGS